MFEEHSKYGYEVVEKQVYLYGVSVLFHVVFPFLSSLFCKQKQAEKAAFYMVLSSHSSRSVSNSETKL